MPVSALWSLVVGLALLALGLAYKIGELTHRVDRVNKEAETLRSELDVLQKSKEKEISEIKGLHQTETSELRKEIDFIKIRKKDEKTTKELEKIAQNAWNAHT